MARTKNRRFVDEQHDDEDVQPYILELMNEENNSQFEAQNVESNEFSNLAGTDDEQNDEAGSSKTRKVRGPTLLKDLWTMPPEKTIDVRFNTRNQAVGKEGRKLASFLGIIARTPQLTPLNIVDWRAFDKNEKNKLVGLVRKKFSIPKHGEEFVKKSLGKKWKDYKCDLKNLYMTTYKTRNSLLKNKPSRIPRDQWNGLVSYWLSDKAKKRSQANKSNRTKLKMPHTGGSKSIGTLMDEKAKDGIEPTRAEVFMLTHEKRKDGRPLDEESAKKVDMIQEKLDIERTPNEQSDGSVAWEGDAYTQVFGPERTGYVRGLGLGPTPSKLWGNRSLSSNISNDMVQRLEQEMKELKESHDEEIKQMKELKEKHNEDMNLMIKNHETLLSELSFMRQVMCRLIPTESSMLHHLSGSSFGQVLPDANSDHGRAAHMPSRLQN